MPTPNSDISPPEVRACLQHLGDASFLAAHRLTALGGYGRNAGAHERKTLRTALIEAVEALRPVDRSLGATRAMWRYQAVHQRYLEGKNVDSVCQALSVSQREFYRLLREGLAAVTEILAQRSSDELPAPSANGSAGVTEAPQTFFGRQRELERLRTAFNGLEIGQDGKAFVVQGLPGIGKSRLLDEFGGWVRSRGGLYLEGHMLEDTREPYDAWIEALAPSLEAMPAAEKDDLRAQSPGLMRLLMGGELHADATAEPDDEAARNDRQRAFYEEIVGFLEGLCRHRPVVLALDDLHWAAGLSLFGYVVHRVRSLRLVMVATIRESQSLDRPRAYDELQTLVRGRHLSVVELPPLSRAETADLIAARLGAAANERLIDTIFERTLGNPFFAEELVRSIWERGDIEQRDQQWDLAERARLVIPATVSATIEDRVGRLTAGVRDVLSMASVLGERFHEGLLGLMLESPEAEMLGALDEAVALGLIIEEFIAGEEGYRFADPLVREALYATIPIPVRRRLHLSARDAIERFYEDDIERHTHELARHYHLAGKLAEGAAHAFRSGEKAEALFAWDTATRWYEMALSFWDQSDGPLRRRAQVCLKLGKLYCQSSLDAAKGVRLLNRALAAFQELGERQFTAMTHLELARVRMAGFDIHEINYEDALSHLNAARATLEKLPVAPGLARVYLGLYTAHARLGEFDEGNEWVEKAKEASTELEDPEVIVDSVVSAAAYILISRGDVARGSEMFEEAWSIASRECLPSSSDFCRQVASLIFGISLKNPNAGLGWIKRQPDYGTRWLTLQSQAIAVYTLLGQFEQAENAFQELKVRLHEADKPPFGLFPGDPGLFLARSGRWEEALALLTEGLLWTKAHKHHLASVRTASVRGGLLLEMGRLAEAEEDLQWAYDTACANHSVLNILKTAPALCDLYVAQGRPAAAGVLLHEHEKLAVQLAPFGGAAADLWLASAGYYVSTGDLAAANDRFQSASDLDARFALPWDEAQVAYKWARSLPETSPQRSDLLQRAAGLWQSLGATRYVELCESELKAPSRG